MSFLVSAVSAQPLETDFFQVADTESFQVGRGENGLWTLTREEPFPLTLTILANRITADPALYLQGTSRLWETQGAVKQLSSQDDRAFFQITPENGNRVVKGVKWEGGTLIVAGGTFPVEHTEAGREFVERFTGNIDVLQPEFSEDKFRSTITELLETQSDEATQLENLAEVRRVMSGFRLDWGPYFPHAKPALYQATLDYLEARYDASFVIVNGEEMGMPETLLDQRLEAVQNRRKRLQNLLENGDGNEGL